MSGFAEGTPTVEIQLGGKSYTLGWNWGAKRRLKEHLATQGQDLKSVDAVSENLPAVLWAALDKDARAELSVEDIEELINPRNEALVVDKIGELFKVSEPDPEVKAEPVAVREPTTGTERSTSTSSAPWESTISA